MRWRARLRGMTLLEVTFAVVIVVTALLSLQAVVAGAIRSSGNSINRRVARELCRAKIEEILAGVTPPDGSGDFDDRPEFRWTSRVDEQAVGMPEAQGGETVRIVVVELEYPVTTDGEGGTDPDAGREHITLASVLPPPRQPAQPGPQ